MSLFTRPCSIHGCSFPCKRPQNMHSSVILYSEINSSDGTDQFLFKSKDTKPDELVAGSGWTSSFKSISLAFVQ